jgi:mono/diheme cytochrome c family protein
MLKPFLLLSAASLLVLSPAMIQAGGSQDAPPTASPASHAGAPNPVKPTPELQTKAKALYEIDCAMCHGENGNGQTDLAKSMGLSNVDFTDAKVLSGKADGDLFDIIRNGKDKMPPEAAGRANDNTVWHLILYIRKLAGSQPAAK